MDWHNREEYLAQRAREIGRERIGGTLTVGRSRGGCLLVMLGLIAIVGGVFPGMLIPVVGVPIIIVGIVLFAVGLVA